MADSADVLASILFGVLAIGCCLAFVVMLIADLLSARKPQERPKPHVPASRWPPA